MIPFRYCHALRFGRSQIACPTAHRIEDRVAEIVLNESDVGSPSA